MGNGYQSLRKEKKITGGKFTEGFFKENLRKAGGGLCALAN